MTGKKFRCMCTGLLCCAMSMASMQFAVADRKNSPESTLKSETTGVDVKGVAQVKESPNVLDPEIAKLWNHIVENFDAASIDYAIQKLETNDPNAIYEFLDPPQVVEDADMRGGDSNDDCITAEPLALNTIVGVDNTIATDDAQSTLTCTTGALNQAVWYTVIGNGTTLTATTCLPGTNYDTKLQVWCGPDCSSLVCVGGNDDFTAPECLIGTLNRKSRVTWCSANGQTYWIALGGFSAAAGFAELTVTSGAACAPPASCTPPTGRCCYNDGGNIGCSIVTQGVCTGLSGTWTTGITSCATSPCPTGRCCSNGGLTCSNTIAQVCTAIGGTFTTGSCATACPIPPSNNFCNAAITVTNGTTPFNLANATTDGPNEPSCAFPVGGAANQNINQDIWYLYTATCTGTLFVDTCGGVNNDTRIAIYLGNSCPPADTPIECNDDHANAIEADTGKPCPAALDASLSIPVTSGQVYTIRVGAFSTGGAISGADQLNIDCVAPGACCQTGGFCSDEASAANCTNFGGTFLGTGTTCAGSNCNTGACCHANGTCTGPVLATNCVAINDVFSPGITCAVAGCSGRCCFLNGLTESCQNTNLPGCDAFGGVWTANLTCATDPCPTGKCCNDQGNGPQCDNYTQQHCDALGGTFTASVSCQPGDCLPAENDTCETAIEIECGDTLNGSTDGALNDYTFNAADPCPTATTAGDDVVYSFTSTVTRPVVVTMDPAAFDLDLFVVTDCGDLVGSCIGSSQAAAAAIETINFIADANVTYYFIVDEFLATTVFDTFVISVSCPLEACGSCPADMDGNGRLDGRDVDAFTDCLTGSSGGSPPEGCGCADADGDEDVDMGDVAVFATILTGSNKFCGAGEGRCCQDGGQTCTDHLTVYECNNLGGSFAAGQTCIDGCPEIADFCEDAQTVAVPSSTVFDTTNATPATGEVSLPDCAALDDNLVFSVWYDVVGTGGSMTATTCNGTTQIDTILLVYTDDCGSLTCVGGNDDGPAATCDVPTSTFFASTFTWDSTLGQVYHIVVGGYAGLGDPDFGTIQLDVN